MDIIESKNYKKDLTINPDALDREWIEQPKLYMYYAEALAEARWEGAKIKQKIEVQEAKLVTLAKKTLERPTIKEIESFCQGDDRIKALKELHIEAEYNTNLLGVAVQAFEHRKKALENLVQLWKGGYYSSPVEEKELLQSSSSMKNAGVEEVRQRVKANMQRRRDNE